MSDVVDLNVVGSIGYERDSSSGRGQILEEKVVDSFLF